jgi:uncharacterized protein YfaQ (DUF2300 family)
MLFPQLAFILTLFASGTVATAINKCPLQDATKGAQLIKQLHLEPLCTPILAKLRLV